MRLRQEQIPQAQGIKPFYSLSFSCEMYWRVSEKSFPQSASPTLRYILPSFGCRSPLRRPYSDKISHKPGLAVHEKPFQARLEAAVSAAAAAQKDQQNQTAVVVIISAATAIIVSAASQKDQDPENAAAVSVSAPEIKQSVSIAPIVASAVTSIVTSTVPFASAVCSSDITH